MKVSKETFEKFTGCKLDNFVVHPEKLNTIQIEQSSINWVLNTIPSYNRACGSLGRSEYAKDYFAILKDGQILKQGRGDYNHQDTHESGEKLGIVWADNLNNIKYIVEVIDNYCNLPGQEHQDDFYIVLYLINNQKEKVKKKENKENGHY